MIFAKFSEKLHEIEKQLDRREGARAGGASPLGSARGYVSINFLSFIGLFKAKLL